MSRDRLTQAIDKVRAAIETPADDLGDRLSALLSSLPARGRRLSKIPVRRRKHLLFDVPVAGADTIPVMQETGTSVLAVDAGRTLLLDRDEMLARADAAGLCIAGYLPED